MISGKFCGCELTLRSSAHNKSRERAPTLCHLPAGDSTENVRSKNRKPYACLPSAASYGQATLSSGTAFRF